jgi:hypothetical protein
MAAPLNATLTGYLPGDILFYVGGDTPSFFDQAIELWTDSRFVHVAIAVSAIQKIEAVGQGVLLDPINEKTIAAAFHYSQKASPFVPANLAKALQWLYAQVGQLYGTVDIVNAVLDKIEHVAGIDHLLTLNTPFYDCSALASEFLITAGGIDALAGKDPHTVTPADLANMLKVKPGQK